MIIFISAILWQKYQKDHETVYNKMLDLLEPSDSIRDEKKYKVVHAIGLYPVDPNRSEVTFYHDTKRKKIKDINNEIVRAQSQLAPKIRKKIGSDLQPTHRMIDFTSIGWIPGVEFLVYNSQEKLLRIFLGGSLRDFRAHCPGGICELSEFPQVIRQILDIFSAEKINFVLSKDSQDTEKFAPWLINDETEYQNAYRKYHFLVPITKDVEWHYWQKITQKIEGQRGRTTFSWQQLTYRDYLVYALQKFRQQKEKTLDEIRELREKYQLPADEPPTADISESNEITATAMTKS